MSYYKRRKVSLFPCEMKEILKKDRLMKFQVYKNVGYQIK